MLEKRLIWAVIGVCALAVVMLEVKSQQDNAMQMVGFFIGAIILAIAVFKNWRLYYRRRKKTLLH